MNVCVALCVGTPQAVFRDFNSVLFEVLGDTILYEQALEVFVVLYESSGLVSRASSAGTVHHCASSSGIGTSDGGWPIDVTCSTLCCCSTGPGMAGVGLYQAPPGKILL